MALNPVQQRALDHLSSTDGSTGYRQSALNTLIQEGFFVPTDSEQASRDKIGEFTDRARSVGTYCTEGIQRFLDYVLEDTTGPVDRVLSLSLRVWVNGPLSISPEDIADQIERGMALLRGSVGDDRWTVTNVSLDDWDDERL